MMELRDVAALFPDLDIVELTGWIEQRWVQPERRQEIWIFQEIDLARVHLIYDLRHALGTPEETVPIVLGLLDQVYELRRRNDALLDAINQQPPDIRSAIAGAFAAYLKR